MCHPVSCLFSSEYRGEGEAGWTVPRRLHVGAPRGVSEGRQPWSFTQYWNNRALCWGHQHWDWDRGLVLDLPRAISLFFTWDKIAGIRGGVVGWYLNNCSSRALKMHCWISAHCHSASVESYLWHCGMRRRQRPHCSVSFSSSNLHACSSLSLLCFPPFFHLWFLNLPMNLVSGTSSLWFPFVWVERLMCMFNAPSSWSRLFVIQGLDQISPFS